MEAGSAEIGIVSGGRSRYTVPGIGGRPGVDARAVTCRAALPWTSRVRSKPRVGGFQKVRVQGETVLLVASGRSATGLPSSVTPMMFGVDLERDQVGLAGPVTRIVYGLPTVAVAALKEPYALAAGSVTGGAGACSLGSGCAEMVRHRARWLGWHRGTARSSRPVSDRR